MQRSLLYFLLCSTNNLFSYYRQLSGWLVWGTGLALKTWIIRTGVRCAPICGNITLRSQKSFSISLSLLLSFSLGGDVAAIDANAAMKTDSFSTLSAAFSCEVSGAV